MAVMGNTATSVPTECCRSRMRRLACLTALAAALLPAGAAQAQSEAALKAGLASAWHGAAGASGAYVLNATKGKVLFQSRASISRILASNTKLFTTSAILVKLGSDAAFATELQSDAEADPATGVLKGDVYLHGGGDPTFGTASFDKRFYGGSGATEQDLAAELAATGITEIRGRVVGDESRFDTLRGGPSSGFGVSAVDLGGPLSALSFNRGLASENGGSIQRNPPLFAAQQLTKELQKEGINVTRSAQAGATPANAKVLASIDSPALSDLVGLTLKQSDNWFAEMLLKDLAVAGGATGTTTAGAQAAAGFAGRLGSGVRMSDGSGLSRANRASPRQVVKLLDKMRNRTEFDALFAGLPIAGKDGTLHNRMRHGAARGRCRAKTGTLSNVSTLSGYCNSRGGDVIEFSLLMNRTGVSSAHNVQDRMANAMAALTG
jgi:D-alanyl-D-alanine carboxypeptidase/D-alanyl-D-alanine-endopeptidase (penicillin-binding protein 4)